MDPFIIDQTPKGSAILAYGAARGPRWNGKLLALVAGSLVLAAALGIIAWFWLGSVALPANQLAGALLAPRRLEQLSPSLRQALPAPWRSAAETRSRFPALFGVALDAERRPHAFALVTRTTAVAAAPGLDVQSQGIFLLLTDGSRPETESRPVHNALAGIGSLRSHDAFFRLRADLLSNLAGAPGATNPSSASIVQGTWDGLVGQADLPPEQETPPFALSAPIFAILGNHPDDARPATLALLSQGIDFRAIEQPPQLIALDPANEGSLALSWSSPLSPEDTSIVAGARGSVERRPYLLPDETEGSVILPTSVSGTASGPLMVFIGSHLASSTLVTAPAEGDRPETCPGIIRFSLNGAAFSSVLTAWNVPSSWKSFLQGFYVTESDHGTLFCIKIEG